MAAEYSYIPVQTVTENSSILFNDGERACKRGYVLHRSGSGVFKLKGVSNCQKTTYKVSFTGNIAVATGGAVGPISVALTEDGEVLGNATAIVTPAAIGDFFNVNVETFITLPGSCCATISVRNTSDGTDIDVQNANIIIDRVG